MKLAFITHNYPIDENERSNAGISLADLVKELIKKRHTVIVLVVNATINKRVVSHKGNLIIYFIGKGSLKKSLGHIKPYNPLEILGVINLFIQSEKEIIRILKKHAVDFCIACWAIPSGILAYKLYQKLQIPYAIWALGSDVYVYTKYPFIGSLIKKALKNAKLLLADGIDLSKKVQKVSGKKCQFLPSATEFSFPDEKNKKVSPKKHNYVFLGRMEKVKGPDILLEALRLIPSRDNIHVDFLGGGKVLPRLKQRAKAYGFENCTTFVGNVHDKQVIYRYLKNASYIIIPSRSDSIPLVLSESAKSNTPVITSQVGDMSSLVKKYNIGYTFPSEDVKKLASIIVRTMRNGKKDKQRFSKNLKVFAKEFDVRTTATSLIELIKK